LPSPAKRAAQSTRAVAKPKYHSDFNVGSMSFSAGELAAAIKKYVLEFECTYEPDFRQ
jgi:hypothetical protein